MTLLNSILRLLFFLILFFYPSVSASLDIPNFDLGTEILNPQTTGFTLKGNAANDYLGVSVSTAGDVNGDGHDDIIIGAYYKENQKGVAYVIYGGKTLSLSDIDLSLITLDPATSGFTITGELTNSWLGRSVSTAGDVNNDGYDDIIVGAYYFDSYRGAAYVIYGGPNSSLQNIDLSSQPLDPATTGFRVTGYATGNRLGYSVNTAGDINKDGFDDVIIGAYGKDSGIGTTYIIYGRAKSFLSNIELSTITLDPSTTGFTILGVGTTARFGFSVSTAGDVNGDGYDDIIIGALLNTYQGRVYVVYGRDQSQWTHLNLAFVSLDPATTGFTITGNMIGDYFGASVSSAGDINNDGYADIIVGAYQKNTNQGAAYVIYGNKPSSLSHLDLSSTPLDPLTTGFTIIGDGASDYLGYSVRTAGDLNGDGFSDMIIGAPNGDTQRGAAYVLYGRDLSSFSNINLGSIALDPSTTGLTMRGSAQSTYFGVSVGTAGDINGDGYDDIIAGASMTDNFHGAVYVIHSVCVPIPASPSCTERQFCQTCNQGFKFTNPRCKSCPLHCQDFSSPKSCRVCDQGYTLSNSLCVLSPPPIIALQKASSMVSTFGSIISLGRSIFLMSGLVSKVVQYTRYMDLSVSRKLSEIYYNWDTDLFSLSFPGSLSHLIQYKSMPFLFARYDLDPAFLANFWSNLIVISAGICIFSVCIGLKKLSERAKIEGWPQLLLKKLVASSQNFILVQTYGCLDDVLFYFILDVRANPSNSAFSRTSLFFAVIFTCLGVLLVLFNLALIKRYQKRKNQGLEKKDMKELENFLEKTKNFKLFYSDYNDDDSWSHSFLAFLVIRSVISSLIIAALYRNSILQSILLTLMDAAVLVFLFFKKPFVERRTKLAQYFFEILALLVHICTFTLSIQGSQENPSESLKRNLSTSITNMNTAIIAGSLALMLFEICLTIHEKIKGWKVKHPNHAVHSISEDSSSTVVQEITLQNTTEQRLETDTSRGQTFVRNTRFAALTPWNFHLSPEFSRQRPEKTNFPGVNLRSSQTGNSRVSVDQETSNWINQQKDQDNEPIIVRRKLRVLKPKRNSFQNEENQ